MRCTPSLVVQPSTPGKVPYLCSAVPGDNSPSQQCGSVVTPLTSEALPRGANDIKLAVCLSVAAGHAVLDSPASGLVPVALAQLSEFWAAIWIISWPKLNSSGLG